MTSVKLAPNPTQNVGRIVSIICVVKILVCAALGFLDIKIIFIGHSEVPQQPHMLHIHPNSLLCLCWFVPVKVMFVLLRFFRY